MKNILRSDHIDNSNTWFGIVLVTYRFNNNENPTVCWNQVNWEHIIPIIIEGWQRYVGDFMMLVTRWLRWWRWQCLKSVSKIYPNSYFSLTVMLSLCSIILVGMVIRSMKINSPLMAGLIFAILFVVVLCRLFVESQGT